MSRVSALVVVVGMLRQDKREFKCSPSYIMRLCLRKRKGELLDSIGP